MSNFYLNEGWYTSEQLADVLEVNKKMNNHLANAIGNLAEGEKLTTHKLKVESLEGTAGCVVATTQDKGVGLTFMQHPWVEVMNEEGDVWILDPVLEAEKIKLATKAGLSVTRLYKKKEWVGLTEQEQSDIAWQKDMSRLWIVTATEAKLKEKNNG